MKIRLAIITAAIFLSACSTGQEGAQQEVAHQHEEKQGQGAIKYTCPMHPQVVEDQPGTCPICGMDLVPITKTNGGNELMLSDRQMRLGNITVGKVSKQPFGETLIVNARLAINEKQSEVISSRAAGRVEKLYVKETGRTVQKGTPLYVLYSETLLTLEREYLLAKEQYDSLGAAEPRYASFLHAAERKLLLYGLTKTQIGEIGISRSLQPRVTFLSPATGIVTNIDAAEGQYLPEGGSIYKIEDISKLWVEAELYANETASVKPGHKVTVHVSGYESSPVEAEVTFVSPEYRANTLITTMRAEMDNTGLRFKPGMQAQVLITQSGSEALAIPSDAVIRDGDGAHVYLQTGKNMFEPRMVKTGAEDSELVEITEGLNEGDTIAITGAYLLYSEIVLKKGSDPMAGMPGM